MFKSFLKLALRNLWKNKTSTAINVLSLSVGLASCALVFLFYQHELSFDKGFDNAADVYRVTSTFKDGSKAPTVALTYAKYLKSEIPEIEKVSRIDPTNGTTIVQATGSETATPYAEDSGYWVDPEFFGVLSFHFLQGDRKTAFNAPNTMVLSASLAKKLFANSYPIGKTLKAGGNIYTVTGIIKEDFLNHIKPDFFASNNSTNFREKLAAADNWIVNDNYYTYVKLRHGSNVPHVINELNAYLQRHAGAQMKIYNDHITNSLQSLLDIHLYSGDYQDYLAYKQGNIKYLYLLAAIALIILVLGCINYMNLTTAQAIGRAREVGVRRVMGAGKKSIRYQFLLETLAVSISALVIAIGLAFLFLPVFNSLTGQALSFFDAENRTLILWLLLITLVTGLAAGLYPAFYLSAFKPVNVLKGKIKDSYGMFSIRKVLIVSQFVISTVLIFATIVIWNQLHFMLRAKPGFDQEQQLVLTLNSGASQKNSALLADQLRKNANFKSVTDAAAPLVSGDMNLYPADKTINDKQIVFLDFADTNYMQTLGLQLVAGSNFGQEAFTNTNMQEDMELHDFGKQIILNEEAARLLGFDPATARGKYVSHLHNGVVYHYKIVGIVKNYHYFSLRASIGPCAIMGVNPLRCSTIIAKIDGRHAATAIQFAAAKWKALNPDTPFSYGFLDQIFQSDYDQDKRTQQMSSIFTFIAIFVSCLGLLGLVTYSVHQKAREIGIRKVVGASVSNIVMLFSNQYLKLILIANIIAWPLAWYLMNKWLQDFSYRTQISWWMFAISLSAGIIIAFATIAFKTIKAAMVNPVESLRAE
ncbi:ABC transporter permease [Mucilaginibacter gotjawali]|uniref:Macrolide export ATP-binding/permease protein MacB n=2 Tax=Mucilaginibacter gotjawali TaxID=1550579 RepID=A0A110B2G1_9SPHI|nr:ABC transporter permease [Mucilaginibacter gotjawali]MBB3058070.1 putative ABC transport system permease protein [Mucilaginibacter gotjawali]BAU52045.1 Macrolide export ATP-binding/permease protein MacB [Mucilaginibacter gotjawali]